MAIRFLAPWLKSKKRTRRPQVFEGLTKSLFQGEEPGTYTLQFKDQIESPDYVLHSFPGKGAMANRFSELLMKRLEEVRVSTHFLRSVNMCEQVVKSLEMLPFRVVIHNKVVGNLALRLGIPEFSELERPIIEFHMKLRHDRDKVITAMHLDALNWVRQYEIDYLYFIAGRINDNLVGQFQGVGLRLLNVNLEFGRHYVPNGGEETLLLLADDLAPENFLVQDIATGNILTIFEQNNGQFTVNNVNYLEIARRFGMVPLSTSEAGQEETLMFSEFKERLENGDVSK
jgi:phosphoribosylaminoimidazole-succinocarboxamide synthase